jgi:hypothetical protein
MRNRLKSLLVVAYAVLLVGSAAFVVGGEQDDEGARSTPVVFPRARQRAPVSLERGLVASERVGTPLSPAFELEGSARHLVVTTMQGDTFWEVIVDETTGHVATVEAITSGEVLTAAIAQRAAMVKARTSLRAAVKAVLTAHPGFRALRVVPTLQGVQPVAEMTLVKEGTVMTVLEPLE